MSRNFKLTDLRTQKYHLAWGLGAGRGTFIILRLRDYATSLRFTCGEGFNTYVMLKRAHRQDRDKFNALCAEFAFSEGSAM